MDVIDRSHSRCKLCELDGCDCILCHKGGTCNAPVERFGLRYDHILHDGMIESYVIGGTCNAGHLQQQDGFGCSLDVCHDGILHDGMIVAWTFAKAPRTQQQQRRRYCHFVLF